MTFSPSERWMVILALGFIAWLLTFIISLGLIPLEIADRSLAHGVYIGLLITIIVGCFYPFALQSFVAKIREGFITGLSWLLIAVTLEFGARWLIDGIAPLQYATTYAPYFLAVPLTCIATAYAMRGAEARRRRMIERARPFRAIR